MYENSLNSFESTGESNCANLFILGHFNIPKINGPFYNLKEGSTKAKIINNILCGYDLYIINNARNHINNTLDMVSTIRTEASVTLSDNPTLSYIVTTLLYKLT